MSILKFDEVFGEQEHNFKKVVLGDKDIHNCVSYIKKLIFKDLGVHELVSDKDKYRKIFNLVCEITAISKAIDFPIINYDDMEIPVIDQFRRYSGRWVDVIGFNMGEFPIFYYPIYSKSFFICRVTDTEYIVCGYAAQSVVNSYSHKSLVINSSIRQHTNMSAFYGFEYLSKLPNNIYEFQNLMK